VGEKDEEGAFPVGPADMLKFPFHRDYDFKGI
jgi:hypothetical protein